MQTAIRRRHKVRKESIFPEPEYLNGFLSDVEDAARGSGVSKRNTRWLIRFLRAELEKGIRPKAEPVGTKQ